MAKINLEYDTVEKTLQATQDGKKMKFTSLMFAGKYDKPDEFNMEMYSSEHDEENDTYHTYRMMCKKYDEQDIVGKAKESFKKK